MRNKNFIPEVSIIPALPEHIPLVADQVRDADRAEFVAQWRSPSSVLTEALQISTIAWTGMIDGVPLCMFGVAPVGFLMPGYGRPWMVGTHRLDRHARLFLRHCRHQVAVMHNHFPVLVNCVAAANTRAIRWLRWLGFQVDDNPIPIGLYDVPFYRFERRSV
jgi:hypothetical protein